MKGSADYMDDISNKIVELSNVIYLSVAKELNRNGIPVTLGRVIVESVYRRMTEDALAITSKENHELRAELEKVTNDIKALQLDRANKNENDGGEIKQ